MLVGWLALHAFTDSGTDIVITFENAHGMTAGNTHVVYRGMTVGKVTGLSLTADGNRVKVHANIENSAAKYLKSGTKFWLRGAHPSLANLASLGAVLSGPAIVMRPGPGKPATKFTALAHRPAIAGKHGKPQRYRVSFKGAVGDLSAGSAVTLRGFTVGEVETAGFRYDAKTGALATPVTLALYPGLFHIRHAAKPEAGAALRAAIRKLIGEGLHARLERDPPLIGPERVTLDIIPGASSAPANSKNGVPQIPAAPGGGLSAIATKLNKVPVDRIAQNLLAVTHRLDALVSSPKLKNSIAQLDASLKAIHRTVNNVGPKTAKLVQTLRRTAANLDEAARAAGKTLGGAKSQTGMRQTLREIAETARSVRALADYLDRHPEALVRGRSGG
jgi:paraquat-inducible protein B